jgi:hypothetical protein
MYHLLQHWKYQWLCPHAVIVALNSVMQLMFLCSCVMFYVPHKLNLFMLLKSVSGFSRLKEVQIWFNWYAVTQCSSTEHRLLGTEVLHICLMCRWGQVAVYLTVNSVFTAAVVSTGARSSMWPRISGSHSHGDAASVGVADLSCCQ